MRVGWNDALLLLRRDSVAEGMVIKQKWKTGTTSKIVKVIVEKRYIIDWPIDGESTSFDELESK